MPKIADSYKLRAGFMALVLSYILYKSFRTIAPILISGDGRGAYIFGDWLINYSGGFIRRGLFGELLFVLSPLGAPILWFIFLVQIFSYAVLIGFLVTYVKRSNFSWHAMALVLSPAAIGFIGWSPFGGFRKEILVLLTLVFLALARRNSLRPYLRVVLRVGGLSAYVLAVFSWEASVFMMPAVAFLLWRPTSMDPKRDRSHRFWEWLKGFDWPWLNVFAFISVIGGVFVFAFRGTADTVTAVCSRVVASGLHPELCNGAIQHLDDGGAGAAQSAISNFPEAPVFTLFFALALLPAATHGWARRYPYWMLMIAAGVIPLFIIAVDWGRWIHLAAMALAIVIASDSNDNDFSSQWTPLASFFYIGFWHVPYIVGWDGLWGGMFAEINKMIRNQLG